jgi:hypothetical protein
MVLLISGTLADKLEMSIQPTLSLSSSYIFSSPSKNYDRNLRW